MRHGGPQRGAFGEWTLLKPSFPLHLAAPRCVAAVGNGIGELEVEESIQALGLLRSKKCRCLKPQSQFPTPSPSEHLGRQPL